MSLNNRRWYSANFFRKQGILVDEGDGDGIDGDEWRWWLSVIVVVVMMMMTVVVLSIQLSHIPHICHFFYTGRIFENQILHRKKTTKGTKNTKNVSEKVKYMHFFTQSGKIYTWQKIFTQAGFSKTKF